MKPGDTKRRCSKRSGNLAHSQNSQHTEWSLFCDIGSFILNCSLFICLLFLHFHLYLCICSLDCFVIILLQQTEIQFFVRPDTCFLVLFFLKKTAKFSVTRLLSAVIPCCNRRNGCHVTPLTNHPACQKTGGANKMKSCYVQKIQFLLFVCTIFANAMTSTKWCKSCSCSVSFVVIR